MTAVPISLLFLCSLFFLSRRLYAPALIVGATFVVLAGLEMLS